MTVVKLPLPAIATGFVRKLYRILDQESAAVITWDADGASFVVLDNATLETAVLPRYFRGRLSAFHQQLKEHGFTLEVLQQGRERYRHQFFRRGCPDELNQITHSPLPRKRGPRKKRPKKTVAAAATAAAAVDAKQTKASSSRGVHRVTPYPVQHEPEPELKPKVKLKLKHAVIEDHAALAANPLFANDESLSGFVEGLAMDGLSMRCVEPTAPGKEEPMSNDVMGALLTLLNSSLSTDGREGAMSNGDAKAATSTAVSVSAAVTTSGANSSSTSSTGKNIFAPLEGRPSVVLPTLPPGIVENGQFSDDTLNCLMHWASP